MIKKCITAFNLHRIQHEHLVFEEIPNLSEGIFAYITLEMVLLYGQPVLVPENFFHPYQISTFHICHIYRGSILDKS